MAGVRIARKLMFRGTLALTNMSQRDVVAPMMADGCQKQQIPDAAVDLIGHQEDSDENPCDGSEVEGRGLVAPLQRVGAHPEHHTAAR
jgi:hypothetical protein